MRWKVRDIAGIVLIFAALLPAGCVRRRMTIRSNPPGALVYVDNHEIGMTPVSSNFTYYGTREIQLIKDGYETVKVKQRFPIPWYEIPPLDFFAENLWPHEIRDERVVDFNLVPQQIVPNEVLLQRAEGLRDNVRRGTLTPLWTPPETGLQPTVVPPAAETVPAPSPRPLPPTTETTPDLRPLPSP